MMSCLILHTNPGARAALRVERLRRSIALSCALNQIYLPDRVLLRLNSRESVDWLIPTIRAISFLGHFLCSKAKICDLCSEVSCLYIRNTKIINLRESSKGDSFFALHYRSSGLRAPAERATRGAFHGLEPMKKRMICCTSILKVRRCFMDLLCVFRCSFQKHFKNGEPGQLVIFVMQRFDINCHLLWKPFQFFSHSFQAGRTTIGRCVLVLCAH